MKLYLHTNGCFYEKQADCPSKSFEAVEFPFAASPKADFVAWMNQRGSQAEASVATYAKAAAVNDLVGLTERPAITDDLPVDHHVAKVAAAAPAPREYFGPQHPLTTLAIEEWCEAAQPHQLGTVVRAAAQRLQVIAQHQEKGMK